MSNIKRGSLIVFEGIDGSGKSTISRKIAEKINARLLFEPVLENGLKNLIVNNKKFDLFFEDPDIKSINNFTEDNLKYHLFMASRVISLTKAFNLMKEGTNVVLDRSFVSTMVYQYTLGQEYIINENIDLYANLAEKNSIIDKYYFTTVSATSPDLIIFLDINLETCLNRLKSKTDGNDMDPKDVSEIKDRIEKYESAIKICKRKGFALERINANYEESVVVDSCLTTILPILQQ